MILTCPECASQFIVDPAAIPAGGREVRCASCKHQWHAEADGNVGELTPTRTEPEPQAASAEDEISKLIAYPDPEPEPIEEEEPPQAPLLPEDAFAGDSDTLLDLPLSEESLRAEPELVAPIDEPEDESFNPDDFVLPSSHEQTGPLSAAPLMIAAAVLVIAVFATSFFALPSVMKVPFGFLYAQSSEGLVLQNVVLRERPARTKARYIIEGEIINTSDEPRAVPTLRIAMIDKDGEVMQSREYEDASGPVIEPGGTYAFKASNLETSFKDKLAWFSVDIGTKDQLRLRKAEHEVPTNEMPNG